MKDIIIFWGSKLDHPLADEIVNGIKHNTYLYFLETLQKSCNLYICRGYDLYLGNNTYIPQWRYDNGTFIDNTKEVKPQAVLDLSSQMAFPELNSTNILNNFRFKFFAKNKFQSYLMFREHFPKSFFVYDDISFEIAKKSFEVGIDLVLKPVDGLKGQGINFFKNGEDVSVDLTRSYILQEFKETKEGIPGIVEGRHDLRIVIINNEIVWAHIRQPQSESKLANVNQGGSIREIAVDQIPATVLTFISQVKERIFSEFDNPVYSIDMGVSGGKPFIYEFNSRIGFPRWDMNNAKYFCEHLAERLLAV